MKPLPILLAALLLAAMASTLTTYLLCAEPAPEAVRAQGVPPTPGVEREIAGRLARLEQRLDELAARPTLVAPEARASAEGLEALVRRVLAEEISALAPRAEGERSSPRARAAGDLPSGTDDLLALLQDGSEGELVRQLRWEAVRAAGRIDEVLAAYEERAKARPDDPLAQLELGNAYLQKLFSLGDGPVKGMVAMQADAAFDRALALDPTHWDARFTKAVSLSHWPPLFGKQAEAIGHFETLVQQQRSMAPRPQHVQTYLLLGNLYQQSGKGDDARRTWQEGLAVFPGDAALLDALSKL